MLAPHWVEKVMIQAHLRNPVRDLCRMVQSEAAMRTSPAAASALTVIDNTYERHYMGEKWEPNKMTLRKHLPPTLLAS